MKTASKKAVKKAVKKAAGTSGKGREREQQLSERDIIDAALRIAREHGVDHLAMRGLAQELGVSPMAIYYYVPNKEQLLLRVAESLLAEIPMPPPSRDSWEQQMRDYALATWEQLSACPGLSCFVLDRPPLKASRRLTLYVLSLLDAAGFDERAAVHCAFGFHTFLGGMLNVQAYMHRWRSRRAARPRPPRRSLTPEDRRLMQHFGQLDVREAMEFGLETLLAGIRAQLAPGRVHSLDRRNRVSSSA